ncbi:Astacin (Peptidase M12A) [Parelaphostrongylus tenuis]|uniref:Astacin (Peptidase M12A) n=1 Tax=Parelaphostrongylus tenuis TaxID=148309 RepID=A0AAD5QKM0_PARTN|nr:Astacin (Peptidase M12A) [Parelaphostrongylus tenuis]
MVDQNSLRVSPELTPSQSLQTKDKVVVVKGNDCSLYVGRLGGDQVLCLDDSVNLGTAVHEIGHFLGFFFTHSSDVYALSYDYGSIMHYGELSCSANHMPTIIAKNEIYQKTMGSELLAFSDIYKINEHYGCNTGQHPPSALTKDSLTLKIVPFVFVRVATVAHCVINEWERWYKQGVTAIRAPKFFQPPGCGADLTATPVEKLLIVNLGHGTGLRDEFDFCNYVIKAPKGKEVAVHIQSISEVYDNAGCTKGGVEVKAQVDQKMTGYRKASNIDVTLWQRFSITSIE